MFTQKLRMFLRWEIKAKRHDTVLGHEAIMDSFHVVLHLVWSGELFAADGTGEDLPLVALVVKECVSLEAVLVLESFLDIEFGTLGALVDAFGDRSIAEQIKSTHGHLRQLLGRVLRLAGGATAHTPFGHLSRRRRHVASAGWCLAVVRAVVVGRAAVIVVALQVRPADHRRG